MSVELIARANAVRTQARMLEGVRGSGYHDEDRNSARPDLFLAPQRNGLPRASEHVVFFTDFSGEEVVFVGPDATRAMAALRAWEAKAKKRDSLNLTGSERKLLSRILPKLVLDTSADPAMLYVRLDSWNDVLFALYAEGVGLSGLPLEE